MPTDAGMAADAGAKDASVKDAGKTDSGTKDAGKTDSGASDAGKSDGSASEDAGSSGGEPSDACTKCEATECKLLDETSLPITDFSKACDVFGDEQAEAGDEQGELKKTLCEKYLACARKTGCADGLHGTGADNESLACFCGKLTVSECQMKSTGELEGACAIEAANAFESNDPKVLLERNINPIYAGAIATWALLCDLHVCADECYDPCDGKADGAACGDPGEAGCMPSPSGPTIGLTCKVGQTCKAASCSNTYQGDNISNDYWSAAP